MNVLSWIFLFLSTTFAAPANNTLTVQGLPRKSEQACLESGKRMRTVLLANGFTVIGDAKCSGLGGEDVGEFVPYLSVRSQEAYSPKDFVSSNRRNSQGDCAEDLNAALRQFDQDVVIEADCLQGVEKDGRSFHQAWVRGLTK